MGTKPKQPSVHEINNTTKESIESNKFSVI